MPQCDCRSRSRRHHPAAQEFAALEANHSGRNRAKRSREGLQISRTCLVAKVDRLSPPKPRRDENELRQTPRPRSHGARLRPAGCRAPSPDRGAQSLHRPWHTYHRARRISPSGERGSPLKPRFVQQSQHNLGRQMTRTRKEITSNITKRISLRLSALTP